MTLIVLRLSYKTAVPSRLHGGIDILVKPSAGLVWLVRPCKQWTRIEKINNLRTLFVYFTRAFSCVLSSRKVVEIF